jgi:hypothetical protein
MQIAHNDFQDQLVRGLAHRMNNILSLFHGYLSLLVENETLDPATIEGLAKIKLGASQASELMDRTQALVRPTATVLREIDVGEYLRMLRSGFEQFRGPRTEIELDIAEDLPTVHGDAARVRTAMVELGEECLRGDVCQWRHSASAGPLRGHAKFPDEVAGCLRHRRWTLAFPPKFRSEYSSPSSRPRRSKTPPVWGSP